MKNGKPISKMFITCAAIVCGLLTSCNKDDAETKLETKPTLESSKIEQPSAANKDCGYVDGYWSSNAFLTNFVVDQNQTNFIYYINQNVADVFGEQSVPLSIVQDNVNPNSTMNAISYGSGKIYFGEAFYKFSLLRGQIVPAFVMAHEFGHQLQYRFGLPKVTENTVRSGELEADGFSGYFMKKPYGYNASWEEAAPGFEFAAEIRENFVNDPSHHGTMPQRRSATRLGWYLGEYELSVADFDYYFFYYYNYVLDGAFKTVKPKKINNQMDIFIMSKMDELQKIKSGEISKSDFQKLSN